MIRGIVRETDLSRPEAWQADTAGVRRRRARSLREVLRDFGCYQFTIPLSDEPDDCLYLSLEQWRGRDFDTTYLLLDWQDDSAAAGDGAPTVPAPRSRSEP
ncbi:hypothetical protein ACQEU5_01810 [Marinactinospora thermotolerans]|uniref:Uncharacterized protein n=1 Tax=Marinactinospora thermotolerans DSM 45154 TaxID=1122192 RepID=A0A1T4M688_9ACTN|nr:hypothetical protein [Marinactinospora thermotolerans]SJZ62387.1 hypothetical protein SAMN02745673_00964 [Marinactinospora thermotolerans DSM 45154]